MIASTSPFRNPRAFRPAASLRTPSAICLYVYERPLPASTMATLSPNLCALPRTNGLSAMSGMATSGWGLLKITAESLCAALLGGCALSLQALRVSNSDGVHQGAQQEQPRPDEHREVKRGGGRIVHHRHQARIWRRVQGADLVAKAGG